jgi:hypothetical protein
MDPNGKPASLGPTRDKCDSCGDGNANANVVRYLIACGDIVCQVCITNAWKSHVPHHGKMFCPVLACPQPCNFDDIPPIEQIRVDRNMLDQAISVREPRYMNNNIGIDREEARYLLGQIYAAAKHPTTNHQALGGAPAHARALAFSGHPLENPFLKAIDHFFWYGDKKQLFTLIELENILLTALDAELHVYIATRYENALMQHPEYQIAKANSNGIRCLEIAKTVVPDVNYMAVLWKHLVEAFVGVLTVRHLSRFKSDEEADDDEDDDDLAQAIYAALDE